MKKESYPCALVKLCLAADGTAHTSACIRIEVPCLACLLARVLFLPTSFDFPFSVFVVLFGFAIAFFFRVRLKILDDDGRCFRFAVSVVAVVFVGHIQYMIPAARLSFVKLLGVRMTAPLYALFRL